MNNGAPMDNEFAGTGDWINDANGPPYPPADYQYPSPTVAHQAPRAYHNAPSRSGPDGTINAQLGHAPVYEQPPGPVVPGQGWNVHQYALQPDERIYIGLPAQHPLRAYWSPYAQVPRLSQQPAPVASWFVPNQDEMRANDYLGPPYHPGPAGMPQHASLQGYAPDFNMPDEPMFHAPEVLPQPPYINVRWPPSAPPNESATGRWLRDSRTVQELTGPQIAATVPIAPTANPLPTPPSTITRSSGSSARRRKTEILSYASTRQGTWLTTKSPCMAHAGTPAVNARKSSSTQRTYGAMLRDSMATVQSFRGGTVLSLSVIITRKGSLQTGTVPDTLKTLMQLQPHLRR
ncbi:uncharacterized protein LTR77_007938 [Saxophila tyrrhenica]|uniref:Uncharacterized protein n=1 Tax=Saxophila tyrrhenica TaxID=1690608 RepID=A0AAV9P3C6_9PEZI|nr:hypothetical protein LTR77_007938 [Saxophila tyrrhenica]